MFQRHSLARFLARKANRNWDAVHRGKSANPREVNGIVEAIALNEEPKLLNWFKMSGAPHARAGVRHRFLKRLEIRGNGPAACNV